MNDDENNSSLVPPPDASLATARPESGRLLSEMNAELLATARGPLFKIGEYEWCEPDYRQILIWAETLELEPEEVIRRLLNERSLFWTWSGTGDSVRFYESLSAEGGKHYRYDKETTFQNGKFVSLNWDFDLLPLTVFEWVEGLDIEHLRIVTKPTKANPISHLHMSMPKLRSVDCDHLGIENLNLSQVPSLEALSCGGNRLAQLDLSNVHSLQQLFCWENNLETIDLSKVPNLKTLECSNNPLGELDLSNILSLEEVFCSECRLTSLNLPTLPKLRDLECFSNQLETLEPADAPNLESLNCSGNRLMYLNLPDSPSLKYLDCSDNRLRHLDLVNKLELKFLDCRSNLIQRLNIADTPLGVHDFHYDYWVYVFNDDGSNGNTGLLPRTLFERLRLDETQPEAAYRDYRAYARSRGYHFHGY